MSDSKTKLPEVAAGFLTHLIELRDRLLRAVIVVAVIFLALFPFASDIYDLLASPLGKGMIIIGPVAPFLIPMKLTLMVAFLVALPYLLYQLWSFVAPGLYKHEKRLVYPLLASSVLLFYLGIVFVYFLLLPMMFEIIPQFVPQTAEFKPDIAQYLDFVVMMFMAFGLGFEMPIATILLISTGMTTAESLKQKRPYVIVGAFVVGMFLTPPDVVSQVMLAIPMWLLFELGLILSRFFNVRIKEASDAKDAMDKSDDTTNNATDEPDPTYLPPDNLWADDDLYTYEEHVDGNDDDDDEDTERSILDSDSDSDKIKDEVKASEEPNFFDNEDFDELSDEDMDEELDRIEAQEKAEKKLKKKAKKRAKKKAKAAKKQLNKNKKPKEQ